MDPTSPLITNINLQTLPTLPPPSSNSNTTKQQLPTLTGDIPPPHFMNSINELRSFSTALTEFLSNYDELHNHLNFINSSIDSKLPDHLVDNTNPNQSPVTHLLEACCVQTITAFPELIVSEQNPKDCERSHAIATAPEEIDVCENPVEIDKYVETDNCEERRELVIVLEQNPNLMANNCKERHELVRTAEIIEEIDVSKERVEEAVVSEQNPNRVASNGEQNNEYVRASDSLQEVDILKKPEQTVVLKKPEESGISIIIEETDAKETGEEIDTSKKLEESLPETAFDHATNAVPEAIISEQKPNRMAYNGEKSLEEVDVSVSEKPAVIDIPKKPEQTDILNKPERIDMCKSPEEIAVLKKLEEPDISIIPEEIDDTLKKPEESLSVTSVDDTTTAVPEAIVSEQDPNQMAANGEQSHENVRIPECLEEIDVLKKPEQTDICENPEEIVVLKKPQELDISIIPEEIDTLKKPEESLPETSFDHATTAVPEAIVSEQNPNGNVRKAESLEEIDVSVSKKPKQTDILNTPEESNICKNPEETVVLKKPKIINTLKKHEENGTLKKAKGTESNICKNPEETVVLKKPKSINTLKRREENGTLKKAKETEASKQSVVSELECLCRSMSSKQMKRHVATHFSEMINLRDEIAKTFKLAEDPAKLVLYSVGRFFVQGSRTFRNPHQNKANLARMAAVLILECFVMIMSDGIEIAKRDREYAAEAAVDWRKRMIKEGGLRLTDEVDARGLLLLISGFGIQDHVFTIQDIIDLIRASNVKGISAALRRSVFLIPKIPEVIYLMVKSNMEIEAVDIAYTFGLEDMCHPQNILTTYLHNKIKDIQNASPLQMLEAVKQHLVDLKSVKQCLESHNVDPSTLLPDFNINEKIQNLEKEVTEWKLIQKRKFLGNSNHQEAKRACFGHENMPRLQKPVDHYGMNRFNQPTTQPSTVYFDSNRNLGNSYITSRSASPAYNASAVPENMPGSVPNGLAGGLPGSYDRTVHTANVQPYVWHGSYDQHYSRYGQTYDSQPNHRPWGQGLPESFPGLPGRQGPSSNLYSFADIVENETRGGSRGA